MNKTVSTVLNIVLLIAVIILFYLHFNDSRSNSTAESTTPADSLASDKHIVIPPKEIKASKIVFVNTDVLNENYEYVKDLTSVAKTKQQSIEAAYKRKAGELQNRYAELQQKSSQGLLSENQTKEAQAELAKRQEELDKLEYEQQQLMEQLQRDNEKVLKSIMDYINEYNKNSHYNYVLAYSNKAIGSVLLASDSLDITNEIVTGLNAEYKTKKGSK